jgi:nucleoside-diphosphate-sugar epimerase
MIALVTGATGGLGRYIVRQLIERHVQVRALCREESDGGEPTLHGSQRAILPPEVEIALGDIRDPAAVDAAVAGVDTVFHAAGLAGLWGSWKLFRDTNFVGTQNVIAACRRHHIERLVYTSSPSVVFTEVDQCGLNESAPYSTRWLSHYPHSKALAEQAVLAANGADGLLTCALRPHLIWGPGDRHLIPRLIQRARTGRARRVGDGHNEVDMIFVENAARAHLQAADALTPGSPVCGKPFFISQGQPVKCWRWVDELLALVSLPPIRKSIPLGLALKVGHAYEIAYGLLGIRKEPPMTRFLASQLGRSHWFDMSAARRDFGYEPTVSIAEGMRRLKTWLDGKSAESPTDSALVSSPLGE